jgi:L-alanine-DL-glutamate epimerase-like enolase superfamily enzyme
VPQPDLLSALPKIEAIEVVSVAVPRTERRVVTKYGDLAESRYALLLVHAEGLLGLGEAPTERWWTGEDAVTVRNAVERYLAPALVGRELSLPDAAASMNAAIAANSYAKAAVETALWDLHGKRDGVPLHELLGGPCRSVPIKYGVGARSPEAAREAALAGKALGFQWFKVKGGGELAEDLVRFESVAEALDEGDRFGVDANAGWSPETARQAVDPLAALGVAFLEQPVARNLPGVLADIAARAPMPVVAHESIFTVEDGMRAAAERIAGVWALTPGTHGGLLPTLELLGIARAHGVGCLLGSTFELGVATAALTHLGSAFDELALATIPSDVTGPLYHAEDIVLPPAKIVDGRILVPDGPGLGVDLDWDRIERLRI